MAKVSQFEELRETMPLEAYAETVLRRARDGRHYVCPACGSGEGPKGTPAFSIEPGGKRWKCFSCGRGGDVFDLAGVVEGTGDSREQLAAVRRLAGMASEPTESRTAPVKRKTAVSTRNEQKGAAQGTTEGRRASAGYIERTRAAMVPGCEGLAYLQARGFTPEEVGAFGIGWDAARRRVVIPWGVGRGEWYHIDRDVTGGAAHRYEKPKSAEVGAQPVHNARAFSGPGPVFVVEGLMDALAVMVCGHEAVAMAGTSWRPVVSEAVARGYAGAVVAMADNDPAGLQANEGMAAGFEAHGLHVVRAPYGEGSGFAWKDASEALQADREALAVYLDGLADEASAAVEEAAEAAYLEAMGSMRALDPAEIMADIYDLVGEEEPVPTGLDGLDRVLDGGLRSGLAVLGAVSSLGKTTLAVQIADHIAASGHGVLFVSIEQSAREITAKSLARIMRELGDPDLAATTREIESAAARAGWSPRKQGAFRDACSAYGDGAAKHLRILEAVGRPGVDDVRAVAERMRDHDGVPPVVFVDYLQLLRPEDPHDSDKQTTDKAVTALRQMARDLRTPVVAISNLNRSSYSGAVGMDSFKESGGIEYGADLLMGLQPEGMAERTAQVPEARAKTEGDRIMRETKAAGVRRCELVILKQRSGAVPAGGIPLTCYPASGLFLDGTDTWPAGVSARTL